MPLISTVLPNKQAQMPKDINVYPEAPMRVTRSVKSYQFQSISVDFTPRK